MARAQASSQAARTIYAALIAPHTASFTYTNTPSPPPSYALTQLTLHTSPHSTVTNIHTQSP